MGLSNAREIAISGIIAERQNMELITSNIANANTTRALNGGTYVRKMPVYWEKPISFDNALDKAQSKLNADGGGVGVTVVDDKTSKFQKVYNPGHPDADSDGYVTLPNVSLPTEMANLVYSNQLYNANITAFTSIKKMNQVIMQIQ